MTLLLHLLLLLLHERIDGEEETHTGCPMLICDESGKSEDSTRFTRGDDAALCKSRGRIITTPSTPPPPTTSNTPSPLCGRAYCVHRGT